MKRSSTLILTLLIGTVSCGEAQKATPSDAASSTETTTVVSMGQLQTKYFALEEDKPTCDETSYRELIYINESKTFYYCDKTWTVVDMSHTATPSTIQAQTSVVTETVTGAQGATGKDGTSGKNGTDGTNGKDGKDAPVVSSNEWMDPVTGSSWIFGRSYDVSHPPMSSFCNAPYVMPTLAQVSAAADNGLSVLSGYDAVWFAYNTIFMTAGQLGGRSFLLTSYVSNSGVVTGLPGLTGTTLLKTVCVKTP